MSKLIIDGDMLLDFINSPVKGQENFSRAILLEVIPKCSLPIKSPEEVERVIKYYFEHEKKNWKPELIFDLIYYFSGLPQDTWSEEDFKE